MVCYRDTCCSSYKLSIDVLIIVWVQQEQASCHPPLPEVSTAQQGSLAAAGFPLGSLITCSALCSSIGLFLKPALGLQAALRALLPACSILAGFLSQIVLPACSPASSASHLWPGSDGNGSWWLLAALLFVLNYYRFCSFLISCCPWAAAPVMLRFGH